VNVLAVVHLGMVCVSHYSASGCWLNLKTSDTSSVPCIRKIITRVDTNIFWLHFKALVPNMALLFLQNVVMWNYNCCVFYLSVMLLVTEAQEILILPNKLFAMSYEKYHAETWT